MEPAPGRRRLLRFAAVGVVNTAVYYGCYLALGLALPYLAAHLVATGLAMVGSYFLNCYFTFRIRPTFRRFLYFPLSNVTNVVVTTVGLYVLVRWFAVDPRPAALLAASVAIPVTYVVARIILVGPASARIP